MHFRSITRIEHVRRWATACSQRQYPRPGPHTELSSSMVDRLVYRESGRIVSRLSWRRTAHSQICPSPGLPPSTTFPSWSMQSRSETQMWSKATPYGFNQKRVSCQPLCNPRNGNLLWVDGVAHLVSTLGTTERLTEMCPAIVSSYPSLWKSLNAPASRSLRYFCCSVQYRGVSGPSPLRDPGHHSPLDFRRAGV
jgi:hypothetical protein